MLNVDSRSTDLRSDVFHLHLPVNNETLANNNLILGKLIPYNIRLNGYTVGVSNDY